MRELANFFGHRSPHFWTRQSYFSRQTGLLECEHPLTDKPMVIAEPTVPSARLVGLGLRPYPNNMPRMLNKDLSLFKQSFS